MIPRRGEDLGVHPSQGLRQGLAGLPVRGGTVKEVSRQQHQLHAVGVHIVRQPEGQLPALPPPLRRPPGRKGGKGAVQMEVRRVDEFQHISPPSATPCRRQPTRQS